MNKEKIIEKYLKKGFNIHQAERAAELIMQELKCLNRHNKRTTKRDNPYSKK